MQKQVGESWHIGPGGRNTTEVGKDGIGFPECSQGPYYFDLNFVTLSQTLPKRSYWDCPQPHEAITMVAKLIFVVWYSMVFSRKENTSCAQYIQSTDVAKTPCIAGCQAHGTCPGY